ncbi:hypothetical protein D3C72_798330 [compost metagenome]
MRSLVKGISFWLKKRVSNLLFQALKLVPYFGITLGLFVIWVGEFGLLYLTTKFWK